MVDFRSAASRANASGTSHVGDLPAGVVSGDLLIADLALDGGNGERVTAVPTGWARFAVGWPTSSSDVGGYMYYLIAGGSEPSTYTWTTTTTGSEVTISAWSGADANQPINAVGFMTNGGSASTTVAGTVESTVDGCLIAGFVCSDDAASQTWTPPGTMTEAYDATNGTLFISLAAAYEQQATHGNVGTRTFTHSSSDNLAGVLVAIAPSGATTRNPRVRAVASVVDNNTCSAPTGVASGVLLVAHVAYDAAPGAITPPSGWAALDTVAVSDNTVFGSTYYKVAGGSEPGSYTWTPTNAVTADNIGILRISDFDPAAPINANSGADVAFSTPGLTTPNVTPTVDNGLRINFWSQDSTASGILNADIGEQDWFLRSVGNCLSCAVHFNLGAAATTATRTAATATTGRGATFTVVVAPVPPQPIGPGFASRTAVVYGPAIANVAPQAVAPGAALRTPTLYGPAIANVLELRPGAALRTPTIYGPAMALAEAQGVAPGPAIRTPTVFGPTVLAVHFMLPGAAARAPTVFGPEVDVEYIAAPPGDPDVTFPDYVAAKPDLDSRWRSGSYIGPYMPHQVVEIQRGRWNRGYRVVPAAEQIDAEIPDELQSNPWMAFWTPAEEWREIDGVASFSVQKDFDQRGVSVGTLQIENTRLAELVGVGGSYHILDRGYLSPMRGYDPTGRDPVGTQNEWFDSLSKMAKVRVWQGYGEPTRVEGAIVDDGGENGGWVFVGQLDDLQPSAYPDHVTLVARSAHTLTDSRVFGWNISKQLRDPVVFSDRLAADAITLVGDFDAASSAQSGHPGSHATDDKKSTYWLGSAHVDPDEIEWIDIELPGGRYTDILLHPKYGGVNLYLGVYLNGGAIVDGVLNPGDDWLDLGNGNPPGESWPYTHYTEGISGRQLRRQLGAEIEVGAGSKIRIAIESGGFSETGLYQAGIINAQARQRNEDLDATSRWILVDDVADMVRVVLRWAGYREWAVEDTGARLKGKAIFNRSRFLMDIIQTAVEQTGFIFHMGRPQTGESDGIPVFKSRSALARPDTVPEVNDNDLLTAIENKDAQEPRAYIIRVRGKDAAAADGGTTLGGIGDTRLMAVYRPPWSFDPEEEANPDRLAGVLKHEVRTRPELSTAAQCMVFAKLLALNEALDANTVSFQIPGHPLFDLDDQIGVTDTSTAVNSRIWLTSYSSEFTTGQGASWKTTLGGTLLDSPDVEGVLADLEDTE